MVWCFFVLMGDQVQAGYQQTHRFQFKVKFLMLSPIQSRFEQRILNL